MVCDRRLPWKVWKVLKRFSSEHIWAPSLSLFFQSRWIRLLFQRLFQFLHLGNTSLIFTSFFRTAVRLWSRGEVNFSNSHSHKRQIIGAWFCIKYGHFKEVWKWIFLNKTYIKTYTLVFKFFSCILKHVTQGLK